jgi:hypothetical protein
VVPRPDERYSNVSISVRSCFFSYSDSGMKAGKLRSEEKCGHPSLEITGNVPEGR